MKRLLISVILTASFGLNAQTQLNCDEIQNENKSLKDKVSALQQDNNFLRDKLSYYDKVNSNNDFSVSSFSSQFDIKILNCIGDRGAQTVKIDFVLNHNRVNQKVYISGSNGKSNAYDEIGNTFNAKTVSLGTQVNSYAISVIPTGIDVRGYIVYRGIIGGTDKLKLAQFYVTTEDDDGGQNKLEGKVDIRNIKIDWQ